MADTSGVVLAHDNLSVLAVTLILIFPAVATVFLGLRVYSRTLTRTFAADDLVIGIAGVLYWGFTFASYKLIKIMYIGYHVWDIPTDMNMILGLKYGYASELLYNPILALVKTSILLFLYRLTGQKVAVQRSIVAILILNGVMMVTTFLLTALQCLPVQANWDKAGNPNAKCLNFADFVTGTACVSVVTDILVLLLPTWIVYDLKIQRKQKLILIGILSFGFVTVIVGIIRVVLLDNYDRHPGPDFTYSVLYCLSTFEIGLSFIAACAPALKPIITKIMPKIFKTTANSGRYYNQATGGKQSVMNSKGFQLEQVARRTEINRTTIAGGDRDDLDGFEFGDKDKKDGIVLTTKTEVRWDETGRRGTSTESLV